MTSRTTEYTPRQGRPPTPARGDFDRPEGLQRYFDNAKAELAAEFVGLTTDGKVVPGLFHVEKTGVSTKPIKDAAEAYITSLTPEQRSTGLFDAEHAMWRGWSNIHPFMVRHGVCLEKMTDAQKDAAFGLLRASLSAAGFETARNAMKLNETIREITGKDAEYGEWLYWLSVFGAPSNTDPWGWQIDGHHMIVNCFVLGDQVVMTPTFMGGEPVVATSGKYAGTSIFQEEEAAGLHLMRAFTRRQQEQAIIATEIPFEGFVAAFKDNLVLERRGVPYKEMAPDQQAKLMRVVELFIGKMRRGHAEVKIDEIKRHLDETSFGWIGGHGDTDAFYYYVYSPVVLIEFDHQAGIALDDDVPTRKHIHTVVRTPNGNDYGKDLLRQHYQRHHRAK